MTGKGLEGLAHTVELTHVWIDDLDDRLAWHNKPRSYRLLKSVLHALRDYLPPNEAAGLGAQLPTLLRGVYYEQWHPAASATRSRTRSDFQGRVDEDFAPDPLPDTTQAIMAVFDLLSKKVTPGEIEDVRRVLPDDLRTIWPEPYSAPGERHR